MAWLHSIRVRIKQYPLLATLGVVVFISLLVIVLASREINEVSLPNLQLSDGEWIAFISCAPERRSFVELFIMRPDGSNIQRVTTNRLSERTAYWSPDGQRLIFTATRETHSLSANERNDTEIYLIHSNGAAGAELRQLTDNDEEELGWGWSPDGHQIIFSSRQWDPSPSRWRLHSIGPDGGAPQALLSVDAYSMAWSPDGEYIAYTLDDELYYIHVDSNNGQKLSAHVWLPSISWSPDSSLIAFAYREPATDRRNLAVIELETGEMRQLTNNTGLTSNPTWSPDGEWIAFSSNFENVNSRTQIYKITPQGTDLQRLTNIECGAGMPSWSPNLSTD